MSEALDSMDFRPLGELLCPEPEERPDLWPWSARRREDGVLEIGGVALSEVAQEFATPSSSSTGQTFADARTFGRPRWPKSSGTATE